MKKVGLLLILIILFGETLSAQEKVIRKLYIDIPKGKENNGAYVLKQYLIVALSENTHVIIVENKKESDCVLQIGLQDSAVGKQIKLTGYDTFFKKQIFTLEKSITDFSIATLSKDFFPEVTGMVEKDFPPRNPEVVEVVKEKVVEQIEEKKIAKGVKLTILGVSGSKLVSKDGKTYTLDNRGEAVLTLPMETTVSFRALHGGYYPENFTVVVEKKNIMYRINQTKAVRFGLEIQVKTDYGFGIFPYFLYYYKPNWNYLYLSIEHNLLLLNILLEGFSGIAGGLDTNIPFIEPVIGAGWFFFPADSMFRLDLRVNIFGRVVFGENWKPYISKIMTAGIGTGIVLDASPWKKFRFFYEYQPRLFYSSGPIDDLSHYGNSQGLFRIMNGIYLYYLPTTILGLRILF